MLRSAILLLTGLLAVCFAACGGSSASSPTPAASSNPPTATGQPSPVDQSGWKTFDTPFHCVTFSYPADWQVGADGDLGGSGVHNCPGGSEAFSKVLPCGPTAVANGFRVFAIAAPKDTGVNQTPASIQVYLSADRCASLSDHMDQVLDAERQSTDVVGVLTSPVDSTIAGYNARCAQIEFKGTAQDSISNACAVEVGTSIYHVFAGTEKSRAADLGPVLDAILASLHLNPIPASATPAG